MAFAAFDDNMFSGQREARAGVVETGLLPVIRVMAGFALLAFLAIMFVVLFVAGDASLRCFLVFVVLVAGFTLHGLMLAEQREAGFAVIEGRFLP